MHRGFDTRRVVRLRAPRLKGPAWLFWEDLAPGALFAHSSVLLLLDARSGHVVMFKRLAWAPMVNGRRTVFLRSVAGYSSSRYRVFTSAAARARSDGASSNARSAAPSVRRPEAVAAPAPNLNLKGVCIVAAGATDDEELFRGDFKAVSDMASTLHVTLAVAGTVSELSQTLSRASSNGCNHIVLFVIGHGTPPPDIFADGHPDVFAGGAPCVQFKGPDNGHGQAGLDDFVDRFWRVFSTNELCADQLKGILAGHPGTKFDVEIESCFAGRFVPLLTELPNVASVGTASGPKRLAFGNIHGGPSDFTGGVVKEVLRWANDPQFAKETGGNITGALEHGDQLYGQSHLDREPQVYDSVHGEIINYDKAHPNGQYVPSPAPPAHGVVPCPTDKGIGAAKFEIRITTSSGQGDGDVIVSPPGQKLQTRTGYTETFRFCFGGPVTVTLTEVASGSAKPGGWILESSVFPGRSPDRCRETGSNISLGVATCTVVFTREDVAWAQSRRLGFGVVDATPVFK
jgi:hypothetical protein